MSKPDASVLAGVILLLILFFFPYFSLQAQGTPYSLEDVYSLESLLAIAIANDRSMELSQIQIQEALLVLESIQATLHPQLILRGEHQIENALHSSVARQFMNLNLLEPTERIQTTTGTLTLVAQLGANTQIQTALKKATLGSKLSNLQKEKTLSNLLLQVLSSYHGVVKAYYGMELASLGVGNARLNLEIVEHKEGMGNATMLEVLSEKNALLEAENQLATAEMGLNVAVLGLLQAIGLESSYLKEVGPFVQQILPGDFQRPLQWEIDYDRVVGYALLNRLEVEMALYQISLAQIDIQDQEAARDWTLSLTGRYIYDDYIIDGSLDSNRLFRTTLVRSETHWPNKQIQDLVDLAKTDEHPWQVGMQFSYTFGDGKRKGAEEALLLLAKERGEIQLGTLQDGISLEVYSNYQKLEQRWRSYQLALVGEEEAQKTYASLKKMYDLGTLTKQDLKRGQLYVANAKFQVLSTTLDYQAQKGELARVLGVSSQELMEALLGAIHYRDLLGRDGNGSSR